MKTKSASPPRFPDFLGIGAQKSGTTWLHRRLGQHARVWVPPLKELHYFDVCHMRRSDGEPTVLDERRAEAALRQMTRILQGPLPDMEKIRRMYALGLIGLRELTDEWYGRIFSLAPVNSVCGEVTPEYALIPDAGIEHILRLNAQTKFIYLLRDPVERGWSALRMMQDRARETGSTVDLNQLAGSQGFLKYSDYMGTIDRYRARVDGKNFLVVYFDDVVGRPAELLSSVCEFLGVPFEDGKFRRMDEPTYPGRKESLSPELYRRLLETLRPGYERLLTLGTPQVEAWYRKHYAGEARV